MGDNNVDKLHAHTVALEQNQQQLHQRIALLETKLHAVRAELGASVMREAALQTEINLLLERLAVLSLPSVQP